MIFIIEIYPVIELQILQVSSHADYNYLSI